MEGLGLLAGLLGGYAQGRQLKQNRSIRQATLKAQQTDRDRQYELEQQKFAYQKLKDANTPRNVDTGYSTMFDRQLEPIREFWKTHLGQRVKAADRGTRVQLTKSALAALPGQRAQIQNAIDQYGKHLGLEGVDPDMYLAGMHGMSGLKYDRTTGGYGVVNPKDNKFYEPGDDFYNQFDPSDVSDVDKRRYDALRTSLKAQPLSVSAQRGQVQAFKDEMIQTYGANAANKLIPFLPGDNVPVGFKEEMVDQAPVPQAKPFALDPTSNPFVGQSVTGLLGTGRYRHTVPDAEIAAQYGTDMPPMFAPNAAKNAWAKGRFNIDPNRMAIPGPFGLSVPLGIVTPKNNRQLERQMFAQRVLSNTPQTPEEGNLGAFIQAQRQVNPNFNPFTNMNDARLTLQFVTPDMSPKYHETMAELATPKNQEYVPQKSKVTEITSPLSYAPTSSAIAAEASAGLSGARTATENVMRAPRLALVETQIRNIRDTITHRRWNELFQETKFRDTSDRGWQTLGLASSRLDFDKAKNKFAERIKLHKVDQDDLEFVTKFTKAADSNIKSIQSQINALTRSVDARQTQGWLNHDSIKNITPEIWEEYYKGEMSDQRFKEVFKDIPMQTAATQRRDNERDLDRLRALQSELQSERNKLQTARTWESDIHKELSGKNERDEKIRAAWKKHDYKMSPEDIEVKVELGVLPSGKKPSPVPTNKTNWK